MKLFITRYIKFFLIFSVSYFVLYQSINFFYNKEYYIEDSIFVWGDSQAFRGINLSYLSKLTNKKVFSSAHHGAGIYDFLVFTHKVKAGSTLIISFPKLAFIRPKQRDYNKSGISLRALRLMYENNYSFNELKEILFINLKPEKNINRKNELYPLKEKIIVTGLISKIEKSLNQSSHFIDDKLHLYLKGVEILKDKKCRIIIVEYPSHPKLSQAEKKYHIFDKIEKTAISIRKRLELKNINKAVLKHDLELFNDATHLNEIGANLLTEKLSKILSSNRDTFIKVSEYSDISK